MFTIRRLVALVAGILLLAACAQQPQTVEVTRVVTQDVPVTVEVTRIVEVAVVEQVPVEVEVEVPVEVTRIVEVVPTAEGEPTAEPAPTEVPPTATPAEPAAGSAYTVASGDTLSSIAVATGVTVAEIMAANSMGSDAIIVGQELFIPGWDGGVVASAPSEGDAPPVADEPSPPVAVAGPNLLPNPSFEGDWYFYLYNELQIPDNWQLLTDEGPNTLEPGSGGVFNRPEVRVVPSKDLPPAERSSFIFQGDKTVKAFKGGAPTSFSMFTDVSLPPGAYRLTINFFPDAVAGYDNQRKTYATDPLAAEMRVIHNNGGTGWQTTQIGQRNTVTYDFTVEEGGPTRLGAGFRNRFALANNGWFIDGWSLEALSN